MRSESTHPDKLENALPPLLTSKQAADLIGCGQRTLWRWSRSGIAPPPVKIGASAVRYRRDEYLAWIGAECPRKDYS
ncbi:MAG: helix-turn-helix domain-containing protein [Planctomycetota bacterium]